MGDGPDASGEASGALGEVSVIEGADSGGSRHHGATSCESLLHSLFPCTVGR